MLAPRLTAVVVFPTPPFWFATATTVPTRLNLRFSPVGKAFGGELLSSGRPAGAQALRRSGAPGARAPPRWRDARGGTAGAGPRGRAARARGTSRPPRRRPHVPRVPAAAPRRARGSAQA